MATYPVTVVVTKSATIVIPEAVFPAVRALLCGLLRERNKPYADQFLTHTDKLSLRALKEAAKNTLPQAERALLLDSLKLLGRQYEGELVFSTTGL